MGHRTRFVCKRPVSCKYPGGIPAGPPAQQGKSVEGRSQLVLPQDPFVVEMLHMIPLYVMQQYSVDCGIQFGCFVLVGGILRALICINLWYRRCGALRKICWQAASALQNAGRNSCRILGTAVSVRIARHFGCHGQVLMGRGRCSTSFFREFRCMMLCCCFYVAFDCL